MKKILLILFILINSLSITAGQLNIVNKVEEIDYSYSIEYLNLDDSRSVVTTDFNVDKVILLDSELSHKSTNPFFVRRSAGNKEHGESITVQVNVSNFKNSSGIIQDFYPIADVYSQSYGYSDFSYLNVSSVGDNHNGVSFQLNVPLGLHSTAADIGAFYLYYDTTLFDNHAIVAGLYKSDITIEVTTN